MLTLLQVWCCTLQEDDLGRPAQGKTHTQLPSTLQLALLSWREWAVRGGYASAATEYVLYLPPEAMGDAQM